MHVFIGLHKSATKKRFYDEEVERVGMYVIRPAKDKTIHNEIIESIEITAGKTITTVIVTMSLKRFSAV